MKKTKQYGSVAIPANVIQDAVERWIEIADCDDADLRHLLSIERGDETWHYDTLEQFFIGLQGDRPTQTYMDVGTEDYSFQFSSTQEHRLTSLAVSLETPKDINRVFDVLDEYITRLPPAPTEEQDGQHFTVFVGHGRSPLWRDLRDHLQDLHHYAVEAYETGTRAGHSVRDVLQGMLGRSSFALLVITADDETAKGNKRGRQNVIHELGLFQGRLGFSKAIAVVEEGVELGSNMQSVQQIRFSPGNIRECFGEVVATLADKVSHDDRSG